MNRLLPSLIFIVLYVTIPPSCSRAARNTVATTVPDTKATPMTNDTICVEVNALDAAIEQLIKAESAIAYEEQSNDPNHIMGTPEIGIDQMYGFVKEQNADFPREIAEAFYNIGLRYGVRGDIALCQSIVETGWFTFTGGTAVTPDQHNYCGLGVTKKGLKGHSFDTIEDGVTAQIQHLYAYACKHRLPKGERLIDPRFTLVSRGIAPTWEGLNRRWAANDHYSASILSLYERMRKWNANNR